MKYYSIWQNWREGNLYSGWIFRKSIKESFDSIATWIIEPELFIVNGEIGVWRNRELLEANEEFQRLHGEFEWEIREFTPLDALKERCIHGK